MKNRIYCTLAAAVVSAAAAGFSPALLKASAGEYSQGDITLSYSVSGTEAVITGCSGTGTSVVIPEKVENTYTVTAIDASAFEDCTTLISITVPDSIFSIGESAFFGCSSLEKVYIGNGANDIGGGAFGNCPSLDAFTVGALNETYTAVEGMLYSKDETELIAYAGGSEAVIPEGTLKIGEKSFYCNTLLSSAALPAGLEEIEDYAFSGCLSLSRITLPSSVTSLGTGTFLSCSALKEAVLGAGLTAIPEACFSSCTALEAVNIPSAVTEIGASAFYACPSLSGIYIPPTVTAMGEDAIGTHYDIRSGRNAPIYGFYISADKGSAAEAYAKNAGVDFIDFSAPPLGDVDGNGSVTAADAAFALSEYASRAIGNPSSFTYYKELAADYNGNGTLEATDAALILKTYAEGAVS